jgi:hypothetical protein
MPKSEHPAVAAAPQETSQGHAFLHALRRVRWPSAEARKAEKDRIEAKVAAWNVANADRIKNLTVGDAKQLYDEVCVNVRTTDDISFKLLGFVPLVSGSGIAVLLSTNTSLSRLPLVIFVGLFGAVVTFGLFRWELKNITLCRWLINLGAALEQHRFGLAQGQFFKREERAAPPKFLGRWQMDKEGSERLIYGTAIVAWLLLPVLTALAAQVR